MFKRNALGGPAFLLLFCWAFASDLVAADSAPLIPVEASHAFPQIIYTLGAVTAILILGFLLMVILAKNLQRLVNRRTADLHAATEHLRASEEKFRRIFNTIPDGYVMASIKGRILLANSAAARILHYADTETLAGVNLVSAFSGESGNMTALMAELKRTYSVKDHELTVKGSDGELLTLEVTMNLLRDDQGTPHAMEAFFSDITQRKKADQERIRLMTAIEQAAEIVMITDPAGTIQYTNPAFERITGYTREEGIGQNPRILKSDILGPDFYKHLWTTLQRGQIWKGRFVNRRKDGTLYDAEATITPVRSASGDIDNYVAVTRDITQDLKLEQQLRQAQKMEAIGTLAGGIAHDFNNILSAVIGYTELSQDETMTREMVHDNLEQVLKAANRARNLIRQILAFSQKVEETRSAIEFTPLIKEALELLRASLPSTIEIDTHFASDVVIAGSPSQIHQIILNLCTNAAYAMKPRGGRLSLELDTIDIDKQTRPVNDLPKGPYARLRISDTGSGIPPEILGVIFDPFFTTKPPGEGTGLGLSIVHGIVTTHNGAITVDSELNAGTTFTIYLPTLLQDATSSPPVTPASLLGSERILIVDDEPPIVDILSRMLKGLGYQVTPFTSSLEALAAFRKAPQAFDAVISDYTMPRMTGLDLAGEMLAIRPDLPILIITGFSDPETEKRSKEAGVKALIAKPITRNRLAEKLREVLD